MFSTIKWDGYKLLMKNHGLLFLGAVTAVMVLGIVFSVNIDQYKGSLATTERIQQYYQEYGGVLTQDTSNQIEAKKQEIDGAVQKQEKLFAEYDSGKLTEVELEALLEPVNLLVQEKTAFSEFYSSYLYCKEDPENRHLVDVKGWSALLDLKEPDFTLFFSVIVLSALLCFADFRQKIRPMIYTTFHGFSHYLYSKWVVISAMAVALGGIAQLLNMVKYGIFFSYQGGDAPIQSIEAYAKCSAGISISQAFLVGSLIRIFGLIYTGFLTVCLIELCRSAAKGCIISLAVGTVPYYVGYMDCQYVNWPSPAGLVQSYLYLAGNPAGDSVNPITLETLARVVAMSIAIIILFGIFTRLCTCPGKIRLQKRSRSQ